MKRTNSGASRLSSAKVALGFAEDGKCQLPGYRGSTWAWSRAATYAASSRASSGLPITAASPPWQSVQPSRTAAEVCMVGASVATWHDVHPADLASISVTDWLTGAAGK